jgi:antiviral defense system Shedu protein SduA
VLGYKETFEKEFRDLVKDEPATLTAYNPRCYLIAGRAGSLTPQELRSFELFRNAQTGVEVLTFDEVERRLQGIRDALSS